MNAKESLLLGVNYISSWLRGLAHHALALASLVCGVFYSALVIILKDSVF